jgi:NAD(P)-dependent dehydrogenase (short-subunit alcohol dehydrogenase family)
MCSIMLIIVTGAGGALGSVVVKEAMDRGLSIAAIDRGKSNELGLNHKTYAADLSNPAAVTQLINEIESKQGPIEGVIHCAGGFRFADITTTTDDDFKFMLEANLTSSFYLFREVIKKMKPRKKGRIACLSSANTLNPEGVAGMSAYLATKGALNQMIASVAREVQGDGIRINALAPTIIDTPANRANMKGADTSTWIPALDLAKMLLDLMEPWANVINGTCIAVKGKGA